MRALTTHTQRPKPGIIVPSVHEVQPQQNTSSYPKCVARVSFNGFARGVETGSWGSRSTGLEAIPGLIEATPFPITPIAYYYVIKT